MRKRNREYIGLPSRWRHYHGAYYYQVPHGHEQLWDGKKQFRLGKTLSEAYKAFGERVARQDDVVTMEQLLDRYLLNIVPKKAYSTQKSNRISIRRLRLFFGKNQIPRIKPKHIYKFRNLCTEKHGAVSANRDLEVLSHCFTKAIEWGAIDDHPMAGKKVVKNPSRKRNRYVEDWEVEALLSVSSEFLRSYIRLKLATGLRKGDMLSMKVSQITEDGLLVKPRKTANSTGRTTVITWTDTLRDCVRRALECRPQPEADFLFCTRHGTAYISNEGATSGFDSIWQRAMRKALNETNLVLKFTEHDLRAKVASDVDKDHAQQLMGHSSPDVTERVYRRAAIKVRPAR